MDITTATPVEIDTRLAELYAALYAAEAGWAAALKHLHSAVGDYGRIVRGEATYDLTDDQAIIKAQEKVRGEDPKQDFYGQTWRTLQALAVTAASPCHCHTINAEINKLDAEYRRRPWVRFYQLNSTDGAHIHDNPGCQGLHRSNHSDLALRPELSGTDAATAVAKLGPNLCSKCYPEAPVEWRQDPTAQANPNACPGAEQKPKEGTVKFDRRANNFRGGYDGVCTGCGIRRTVRQSDMTIGKHDKPKTKTNEITNPDGSPLKGAHGVLKTVRSAQIEYVDDAAYVMACTNGFPYTGRKAEAVEVSERILTAMAHTAGVTVEAKREELSKKVAARVKRDYSDFTGK